jgi:sulfotransferase family protein
VLPTFLVIGAPKAGTTSLYHYLREHPEIYMPETKEVDFFVAGRNWPRGVEWYERQFKAANGARATGEASPRYAMYPLHPGIPERISGLLPDVQLVYLVRNPVKRMISHYLHFVRSLKEDRPPEVALLKRPDYVSCSRYAMQIERYLEHFRRDQLLVVVSERMYEQRAPTLAAIFEFLGVDPSFRDPMLEEEHYVTAAQLVPRPATKAVMRTGFWNPIASRLPEPVKKVGRRLSHEPTRQPEITPALREQLEDLVREDVSRLRRYVGGDFDGWGIA